MRRAVRILLVAGGFVLLLGGCVAWNETGTWRAERRVRALVRPGMTAAEFRAAFDGAGIETFALEEPPPRVGARLRDVRNLYIGTADLLVLGHLGEDGRVVRVETRVLTICL